MEARLIERTSAAPGPAHPLASGSLLIGRGGDCHIVVACRHVSRHHAEVGWAADGYRLRDLGSKNGTIVNGVRITVSCLLRDGDRITLPSCPDFALLFEQSEDTLTVRQEQAHPAGLHIDTRTAEVWVHGRPVKVSAKGFVALALLAARAGALVPRDQLAAGVWPEFSGAVSDDSIEQLISRLRRAIETDPERPRFLLTVRGLGYRLVPDAPAAVGDDGGPPAGKAEAPPCKG